MKARHTAPPARSAAVISTCKRYRYRLSRHWDAALPLCAFVMLNPSTADGTRDDPTIRRCVGFARAWGCGGLVVVNLFAFRSPRPSDLAIVPDPVGPENDTHVLDVCQDAAIVVAAWGAEPVARDRAEHVVQLLAGVRLECLGKTKGGFPRHPLYVPTTAERIAFTV